MDWLSRMNGAVNYIEEHLTEDIDYSEVAKIASCSTYHFQRMFSFIIDVPLSEYIRRRRLTLAAFELQKSDIKVIDLAVKYCYDSPISFTRAFQNLHGVTPSLARDKGVQLKAYPCISFHISIKGDVEMNYRIEQKEAFSVFGVEKIISTVDGKNHKEIPEFWLEAIKDGVCKKIGKAAGIDWNETCRGLTPTNSVMCYKDTGKDTFPYMICAYTPKSGVPKGYTNVEIAANTWAIFKTVEHTEDKTPQVIQELWKRIYSEWFPTSGYEHGPGPELEMYYVVDNNQGYCEVWIPVAKN